MSARGRRPLDVPSVAAEEKEENILDEHTCETREKFVLGEMDREYLSSCMCLWTRMYGAK